MVKTKELSKDTRNKIVALHQAGKTESAIANQLEVKKSTVGVIIRKWKTYKTTDNLSRSGAPRKIPPRGVRMITRTDGRVGGSKDGPLRSEDATLELHQNTMNRVAPLLCLFWLAYKGKADGTFFCQGYSRPLCHFIKSDVNGLEPTKLLKNMVGKHMFICSTEVPNTNVNQVHLNVVTSEFGEADWLQAKTLYYGSGFIREGPISHRNSRLQLRKTSSFPTNFGDLRNSSKDIDAHILAVLPKELRKLFEPNRRVIAEMKRKERIARRLEGIENEAPPIMLQNRLLEEDTPRYTRATDAYTHHIGHTNDDATSESSVETHSKLRYHPRPADLQAETTNVPGHMETPEQESKADRIARYKAERRRQLAEKYGLPFESEGDSDFQSRYTRNRKDSETSEKRSGIFEDDDSKDNVSDYLYRPESRKTRLPDVKHHDINENMPIRDALQNLENNNQFHGVSQVDGPTPVCSYGLGNILGEAPQSPKVPRRASQTSPKRPSSPVAFSTDQQQTDIRQGPSGT
ncbi:unnamed protein product [Ranitomeya imitator]|uniref:Sleeping Beauty transposase HTH domain-containing protein n=1 Tax=Ranitomeya imitator TaxID=111125 RepID=A0ABN9MR36_9NEOB|nr:unnamed protein product [Ranitomeya imitator]